MVLKNDKQIVIIITAALYNEYKRFQTNQFPNICYHHIFSSSSFTSTCDIFPLNPTPASPFPQHNKVHEKGETN